jgi:hypothetical protein
MFIQLLTTDVVSVFETMTLTVREFIELLAHRPSAA